MHDVQPVQVLQRAGRLREEEAGLGLGEDLLAVLVEEEVAVLGVLEHHVDAALLAEGVPERSAVRVAQLRVDADFPLDELELGLGGHVGEVDLRGCLVTTLMA